MSAWYVHLIFTASKRSVLSSLTIGTLKLSNSAVTNCFIWLYVYKLSVLGNFSDLPATQFYMCIPNDFYAPHNV